MTIQFSVAVRNAMLDAIETTMGTAVKIQIYTGAQPANCAAVSTGTKIAEFTLALDWASAAASGSKAVLGVPLSTTGINGGGVAGYYRFVDSAGVNCHEQGSITATGGGGDMTIDNTTIATGQTVQITGFTKTAPGA